MWKNMKLNVFLSLFLISIFSEVSSQSINFVRNSDFELFSNCPNSVSQINNCLFWKNVDITSTSVLSTPDYLNICATSSSIYSPAIPTNWGGFQNPESGSGYAGIYTYLANKPNYREYIKQDLGISLVSGVTYQIAVSVNLADNSAYCSNNFGVCLSASDITINNNGAPYQVLNYLSPQLNGVMVSDTVNWTTLNSYFKSNGNERYLTIGNFVPDNNTTVVQNSNNDILGYLGAYYYVEDVSVSPFKLFEDVITLCDSNLVLNASICDGCDLSYTWTSLPIDSSVFGQEHSNSISVFPTVNTTYQVLIEDNNTNAIFFDEVYVEVINDCSCDIQIPNVFTPNSDGYNDFFYPVLKNIEAGEILIYNRWGNVVFYSDNIFEKWDGRNLNAVCPDGVYYYIINYTCSMNKMSKTIHGSVTKLK